MKYLRRILLLTLMIAVLNSPVAAHPHHSHAETQTTIVNGFRAGFLHPLLGADHFLAMVAIGILSVRAGGRFLCLGPLCFLLGVTGGGLVGLEQVGYSGAETLVAVSVVALGLTLTVGKLPPRALMLITFALFGCLHGYEHGAEIPDVSEAKSYVCGFLIGSIFLHVVGISIGLIFNNRSNLVWTNPIRLSGAAIAVAGLFITTSN